MSRSNMPRSLDSRAPATVPQMGSGAVAGEQLELLTSDGKTVAQRIEDVVAAIGAGVAQMGGTVAFAAHLEKPVSEVSRRVNRADDGKGTRMEPFAAYFAFFDDGAFEAAMSHMLVARGYKPAERVRKVTAEERADLLGAAVTDKVKRQIERENGLPVGSLG